MTKGVRYTEEFKRNAVTQVVGRGYSVKEVSDRWGISTKSLYGWIKQYQKLESLWVQETDQAWENRRLKVELARVTEERDILKKATAYFARETKWSMRLSRHIDYYFLFGLCVVFWGFITANFMRGLNRRWAREARMIAD